MKKICFFTNSMFKLGGEQRITTEIANGLCSLGYDVTILIKHKEKIDLNVFKLSKKIHIHFLDVNYDFRLNNINFFEKLRNINRKTGIFKYFPRLIRHFFCSNKILKQLSNFFINNHFDFVIGVAGDRSFILSLLKPVIRGKIIFWNHQSVDAHFKKEGTRYYNEGLFIEPLLKRFDEVIVLTNYDKEKLENYYNITCRVISNCKSFETNTKSALNHNRFLAVGRLVPQKGFDYLLEAMHFFSKNNKNWNLDIYGEGEEYKSLLNAIKYYHLDNRVKIYSQTKNMLEVYLNHDIFLIPSRYEGFGLVTLEAMECGLPVIGFDIPANKELITNGKNGFLVPCYDIKEYAKTMEMVANNPELMKKTANLLSKSIEKYSFKTIIFQWHKMLNETETNIKSFDKNINNI